MWICLNDTLRTLYLTPGQYTQERNMDVLTTHSIHYFLLTWAIHTGNEYAFFWVHFFNDTLQTLFLAHLGNTHRGKECGFV